MRLSPFRSFCAFLESRLKGGCRLKARPTSKTQTQLQGHLAVECATT